MNFRIYKYQWSLWLAEYLPGRENWSSLYFLRVKWEMFGVYGKTLLFQLTYTITCHVTNNLVTRSQRDSLNCFPLVGDDVFSIMLTEILKSYPFLFAKGIQIVNKKIKLIWPNLIISLSITVKICPIAITFTKW